LSVFAHTTNVNKREVSMESFVFLKIYITAEIIQCDTMLQPANFSWCRSKRNITVRRRNVLRRNC